MCATGTKIGVAHGPCCAPWVSVGPGAPFWCQLYPTELWRTAFLCATGKCGSQLHHFGANFTPHSRGAGNVCAPRLMYIGGAALLSAPRLSLAALYLFGCTTHHPPFLLFSSPLLPQTIISDLLAPSSSPPHFLLSLHIFCHINLLIFFIYM